MESRPTNPALSCSRIGEGPRTSGQVEWLQGFRMRLEFDVVIERDEDGLYVGSVPALSGCHTQAKSLDTLMERVREAIQLCLDVERAPTRNLEFVGGQRITI
jgi:predicted RNase H-like HicB family nuclease